LFNIPWIAATPPPGILRATAPCAVYRGASEVACDSAAFPVAVAGRLRSRGSVLLRRSRHGGGGLPRPPRLGFGQRPACGGGQLAPRAVWLLIGRLLRILGHLRRHRQGSESCTAQGAHPSYRCAATAAARREVHRPRG